MQQLSVFAYLMISSPPRKLLMLPLCVMAIAVVASASTVANLALHGADLSIKDNIKEDCLNSSGTMEADLFTYEEIKNDSYKNPENAEKLMKNGCFASCVLRTRGLIIDSEIQKEKLYGKEAHEDLNQATLMKIHENVNLCVDRATESDVCEKSLSLVTCLYKDFI